MQHLHVQTCGLAGLKARGLKARGLKARGLKARGLEVRGLEIWNFGCLRSRMQAHMLACPHVGVFGCVLISPCCSSTIRKRIPCPGLTRATIPKPFRGWAAGDAVPLQAVDGSRKSGAVPAECARRSNPGTDIGICTIPMKAEPADPMSSPSAKSGQIRPTRPACSSGPSGSIKPECRQAATLSRTHAVMPSSCHAFKLPCLQAAMPSRRQALMWACPYAGKPSYVRLRTRHHAGMTA